MATTSIPNESWRYSIFARVYVDADGSTPRRRVPLLIGLALWLLFAAWLIGSRAVFDLKADARTYFILASLWMLISPLLVAQVEQRLGQLLGLLEDAPKRHGWKIAPIETALCAANRWYWIVVVPFTLIFAAGFIFAQPFMETTFGLEPLSSPLLVLGLFCMTATGFASGNGVWGAYKVLELFRSLARSDPAWYPVRYRQIHEYEELTKFALTTALTFSAGSLFAPIGFLVLQHSTGVAIIPAAVGLLILMFGASALFIIPVYHLVKLAACSRKRHLELIADEIEIRLTNVGLLDFCEGRKVSEERSSLSLEELLDLRTLLTSVPALGRPIVFLLRVSLLIIVPFVIAAIPPIVIELVS